MGLLCNTVGYTAMAPTTRHRPTYYCAYYYRACLNYQIQLYGSVLTTFLAFLSASACVNYDLPLIITSGGWSRKEREGKGREGNPRRKSVIVNNNNNNHHQQQSSARGGGGGGYAGPNHHGEEE